MPTSGFNHAPEAAIAIETEASRIIRTAAFNIERRTKQNLQSMVYTSVAGASSTRTGALLNGTYTMTSKGSGYAAAAAQGMSKGRSVNSDAPQIESPTQARVVNAMEYAFFVHDGTRFVQGRPFMRNAAEEERPRFNAAWGRMHLVPGMGGGTY